MVLIVEEFLEKKMLGNTYNTYYQKIHIIKKFNFYFIK